MNPTLRLICISTLFTVFGFAGVQPLAVDVMEAQGLGPTTIGLLSALIFGGVLMLAPFQPALVERFGAIRTYQAGKALATGGFICCAWANHPLIWAISLLLLGWGGA
jgi:MFS family permease